MEGEASPLQELMTGLRQIDINLSSEAISRKVILLMGQTKAGKTTLYYYLSGKKLIFEKNQNDVWQLFPEAKFFNANIGNNYESQTVYPNIPPLISEDDVMVIDMPGFDDSRHNYRLLNIAILLKTLKLLRQVHVCHVIPFQCLESDLLVQQFQKTSELFNKNILKNDNNISFIITKVQEENVHQIFLKQIDDILEEHIMEELQEDMKIFKTKNLYEFWSKLPVVQEGLHLMQKIIYQNTFLDTNLSPSAILSENYSLQMVGKNNLEQFSDYLMEIIDHISVILQPLILVFTNIVIFELQPILSTTLRYREQLTLESIVEHISINVVKIKVYGLQEFVFKVNNQKEANSSLCLAFLKCLKKPTSQVTKNNLALHFISFSDIIASIRRQKSQLKDDFLSTIQNCLKEMSSLILLIKQVKIEKVQQRLDEITESQTIKDLVEEHYKFWELNQSIVTAARQFGRFSNNQEIIQLMSDLGISIDEENIIEIVRKYNQPRNKELKKLISKQINQSNIQGEPIVQEEDYNQLAPQMLKSKVRQLPVSSSSLQHLKNQLQLLKDKPDKMSIKIILGKISQIFYCFSYFQEAIMFKMCINDENTLFDLLQEGTSQECIRPQFIKTILLPYYCQINPDMSKLELCYNYLTRFAFQLQQLQQIQRSRFESIEYYLSNPQNAYLISDRYKKLEFYYIQPILQNFQYYLQEIEKKRSLFMKSPISSFTSFINERMRQ